MDIEIRRDYYLQQLLERRHNGLVKIVSGVRRCGKSYLLRHLFKNVLRSEGIPEDHILEMAFDLYENEKYRDPAVFYAWVQERVTADGRYYFLLDEIQLLGNFVSLLNSLTNHDNFDVYVTGSNARFLSKDIATEFGGRGDEVRMYPLSFAEFTSVYLGHPYDGWNEYLRYGGIPLVVLAQTDERKVALLENLLHETYLRDIVLRYKIRNRAEMEALFNILASTIGSLVNPNKLAHTFQSLVHSKISTTTLTKYLSYFEDSFLVESAKRFDVKGKAYIGTPFKFYFSDLGLRHAQISFRQQEITHAMENVIYNELRMRGFHVDVGTMTILEKNPDGTHCKKQIEIDFVCNKGSTRYYIQSAYMLDREEKVQQEIRPLLKIKDGFKKILITGMPQKPYYREDGIYVTHILDFLLHSNWL